MKVPPLSRLREYVGQEAYESNPIDAVRRLQEAGRLPTSLTCALSGVETEDIAALVIDPHGRDPSPGNPGFLWPALAMSFVSWLPLLFHFFLKANKPTFHGKKEAVPTPIRIASKERKRLRRMDQFDLKALLSREPVYARLLEAYPHAQVIVPQL